MTLIKPWTLYVPSLLLSEQILIYRQKLLLSVQGSQDAGSIPVNPSIRNFQFSECLTGFSLKAMPQEIQRLLFLRPYPEKVMFCDKFYFSPSTKENGLSRHNAEAIWRKEAGMERKGAHMASWTMLDEKHDMSFCSYCPQGDFLSLQSRHLSSPLPHPQTSEV